MIEGMEIFYHVATAIASAGAVYGGIRADIRNMHEKIKIAHDEARRANDRIDQHIDRRIQP